MHASFVFVDAGRTFDCRVEPLRAGSTDAWWWFRVSSERNQRYAPFRATPEDTPESVRARILAYYEARLANRAEASRWEHRPAAASRVTASTRAFPSPSPRAL